MSIYYRVYITPRSGETTYSDEIEITDYVKDSGVGKIRRGIDSTDYGIGVYFYDDITIIAHNINGYFNDENDYRSIFKHSRDRAKVRVVYYDGTSTIVFRGLLNEEATRTDAVHEQITFKILSRDSVIRNVNVASGLITNGNSIKTAITNILSQSAITSVLNVSASNINPSNDITIDDVTQLQNRSVKDTIDDLLLVSNSVMIIDSSDNVIVKSRDQSDGSVISLYGPYDLKRRQNIIKVKNYNTGMHRMFTAVKVNSVTRSNTGYAQYFGYRQKSITIDFITDSIKATEIADALLNEFKTPRIELEVTVPTSVVRTADILDRVSINYPLRLKPYSDGNFMPVIGVTKIGDTNMPLPSSFGSISIAPEVEFKILEIKEDPKKFETTLKLRQTGVNIGDGYLGTSDCATVGFAVIGVSTICGTGDTCATFNPSVIGAAKIGCTTLNS